MAKGLDHDDFLRKRLSSDDELALELLFRTHYSRLKGMAYRIVGNGEMAKDIVQEVLASLWEKRQGLPADIPLQAYLFRAVINRSLNVVRDHPKTQLASLDSLKPEAHATPPNETGARLEEEELKALIAQSIQDLPPQCRIAFQLSRDEEMSYKEIADHMGVSVKAVEKHITRALKQLRDSLHAYLKRLLLLSW